LTLDITEARKILDSMMGNPALLIHVRSVEIVMRALAVQSDEDQEQWAVAGLLHDADYEKWPDEHPDRIVSLLRERGEDVIAHAISAHYTHWNVPYDTLLSKALLAADELTGFIIAVARLRPGKLQDLKAKSVKKKLKDKGFAKGVDRGEVQAGVELLGVDLSEHIDFIVAALRPHEAELLP